MAIEDRYLCALNERDLIAKRLNELEGPWTDVLHKNRDLVKEYIMADNNIRLWEELYAC